MSNVLQWAQLSVASAQLSEIHNLNAQFQAQQSAHHRQAALADMLFQTERRARQLSVVAGVDALVAAICADEWFTSIQSVTPEMFVQLEHKRIWASSFARVQALRGPLSNPAARNMVHQVRSAAADIGQIYRDLKYSASPEVMVSALRQEHDALAVRRDRTKRLALVMGLGVPVFPIVFTIVAAILAGIVKGASGNRYEIDSGCIGTIATVAALVLFAGAIFNFTAWNDAREKMSRRTNELLAMENAMGRLNAFYADPNRGGVLSRFYVEHPVYGHPLPNVDDMPPVSVMPASSHVIERQTVVVRCKYCQNLTPVDSHACRTCGAAGFA
jgi:hypothetical protein